MAKVSSGFVTSSVSTPGITNGNNGLNAGASAIVGQPFTSYTLTGSGLPAATLSLVSAPDGVVWVATQFGTSGYLTWTPVAGQQGDATFTLTGANSSGSVTKSYTVHVYPAGSDLLSPSTPGGLLVDQVSWSSSRASWTTSTDNLAVTGYRITATHLDSRLHAPPYADQIVSVDVGVVLQTTVTGLSPSTTYDLTVQAFDAASNLSAQAAASIATRPQPFVLASSETVTTQNADGSLTLSWPGYGYYWGFTAESSPDLMTWTPLPPANQWPSFATSFTFTRDTSLPALFYHVKAAPAATP